MPSIHPSKAGFTVGALALLAIAVAIAAGYWVLRDSESADPEWLLTHSSNSAQFTLDSPIQGQLRLLQPSDEVFLFSDRPERLTATVSVDELISQWSDAFGNDAPNATLVDDTVGHPVAVLELGQPAMDGADLTFPVSVISTPAGELSDDAIDRVHLFIDPPDARLTWFRQCPMGGSC